MIDSSVVSRGLPVIVIGTVLMTIGVALLGAGAFATTARRRALVYAGALSALYGLRLAIRTALVRAGGGPWLPYFTSALEYIVPIPALALFMEYPKSWRVVERVAIWMLGAGALVAIPIEIATRSPYRFNPAVNVFVMVLMVVFFANVITARPANTRAMRILFAAGVVFASFIVYQHAVGGDLPIDAPVETIGFVVFLGAVVYVVMHIAVTEQEQFLSVRGELSAARAIQTSIIPRTPPRIAALDIATLYAPASDVGGDFFDFVPIDDHRLGVFIADVAGHGVPAALVASMLKIAVATQAANATDPAALLAALNDLFRGKLERQFITAAYVYVDVASATVVAASAGHPPVLLRHGASVVELPASGPILGRFRDVTFTAATAPLAEGDAIVLFTDGAIEARNGAGEQFGDPRLIELLSADRTASQTVDAIQQAVGRWSRTIDDDVTAIAIRVNALPR